MGKMSELIDEEVFIAKEKRRVGWICIRVVGVRIG
jgi:hypothetical protein